MSSAPLHMPPVTLAPSTSVPAPSVPYGFATLPDQVIPASNAAQLFEPRRLAYGREGSTLSRFI